MALLDDLTDAPPRKRWASCRLCAILDELPEGERAVVESTIKTKSIDNYALAEILTKNGYPISEASIRRHRRHGV